MKWALVMAASLLPGAAAAQLYHYVDRNGRSVYTDDINKLPRKMKDRILKRREQEAEARKKAGLEPLPPPAARPARRPTPAPRPTPTPRPLNTETAAPPAGKPVQADQVAALKKKIAEAEQALVRLRRRALEVPSGMAYDARNKAAARLDELRAELAAMEGR